MWSGAVPPAPGLVRFPLSSWGVEAGTPAPALLSNGPASRTLKSAGTGGA